MDNDEFQTIMLQMETEQSKLGTCSGQQLAGQLYDLRQSAPGLVAQEDALHTAQHQVWQGSGYAPRGGRAKPRKVLDNH